MLASVALGLKNFVNVDMKHTQTKNIFPYHMYNFL